MGASAWGIDLTGGAVRAVRVERNGSRFRVHDALIQPITPPGEGAEPLEAHLPEGVGRGLTDLLQTRRFTLGDPIFVAMPAFGSRQGRIEVPAGDPGQVERLLDFELHHALKGDLEPWIVRTDAPPRVPGRAARGVAVGFHAHRRELVQSLVADLRRFGLPLDALVPGPLALARYADLEWPSRGRRLVLEVQRTRSDLVYSSEHGPRWRSLPFGCGTLPESEGAPVPLAEVDRLAARLFAEHQLAHRSLFGAHDGTPIERAVLLGDGARFDELKRALQDRLGVEVVLPHTPRHVTVTGRAASGSGHHVLACGTALGLAIAALDRRGVPDSLVVPPPARRAARRLPALSASLLVLALGLLATRFVAEHQAADLAARRARLEASVAWSATGEFAEARRVALAAAEESRARIAAAAALRRQLAFPTRLLQALSEPSVFFKLVEVALEPQEDRDEATLTFEVARGLEGAAQRIEEHLERHAGLTVVGVETEPGEGDVLRVRLRAAVHGPEASS